MQAEAGRPTVAEELDSRESKRNDEEEATAARGLDELDREDCRESPNKVYGGLVPPWDRGIKEMRSLDRVRMFQAKEYCTTRLRRNDGTNCCSCGKCSCSEARQVELVRVSVRTRQPT